LEEAEVFRKRRLFAVERKMSPDFELKAGEHIAERVLQGL